MREWNSSKLRSSPGTCPITWATTNTGRSRDSSDSGPGVGDLIPGTGGFRKIRWADKRRGKGRRGGLRVIYYHFAADHQIWLMTLYSKNEAADLAPEEKKALKTAIEGEGKAREAARRKR